MIRAGMRVPFRATHLPGFDSETFVWCRVLSCSVTPIAAGERYRLTLELTPLEPEAEGQFAALLQANYGSDFSPAKSFETTGDNPIAGWYPEPTAGSFSFAESSAPYYTIVVEEDMTVRIEAAIWAAAVAGPTRTMSVRVNGYIVGSSSYAPGGGYWNNWFQVDIPTIDVFAGDEITMDCYGGDGWGGFTVNTTYLRVGRGTHVVELRLGHLGWSLMGIKVTNVSTVGQPLAGGSTLSGDYPGPGDEVDVTTGLPLDNLLDVDAAAPDDRRRPDVGRRHGDVDRGAGRRRARAR